MSDVDPFDGPRSLRQTQGFAQTNESLLRLDEENLRLYVLVDVTATAQVLQRVDLIPQPSRFFISQGGARLFHFLLHFGDQLGLLAGQHHAQSSDLLTIFFPGDAKVARGGALVDAVQNAGPEPAPARIVFLDIQRAGAEFENALQDVDGEPQALRAREGTIQFDAPAPWGPRELHARKIFTDANLQIGKGLVVFQVDVEAGLNVLHQPCFHEQGV